MKIEEFAEEICPYCDSVVELPPFLGIYKCPECGELIICCSMCDNYSCNDCKYVQLTDSNNDMEKIKEIALNLRYKKDYHGIDEVIADIDKILTLTNHILEQKGGNHNGK